MSRIAYNFAHVAFFIVLFSAIGLTAATNSTNTDLNVALCGIGSTICPPLSSGGFIALIIGCVVGVPALLLVLVQFGFMDMGE